MSVPIESLFGGLLSDYKQSLSRTRQRQELLMEDASNKMTPGYKPKGLKFSMYLSKTPQGRLKGHREEIAQLFGNNEHSLRPDENGVDFDATVTAMNQTMTQYLVLTDSVRKYLNGIEKTIREAR